MEAGMEKIEAKEAPSIPKIEVPKEQQERYFCIKVAGMKDKFDIPNPTLTVGNRANKHAKITIKRRSWIPMVESQVQVLRNTKYNVWQNVEGEERKVAEVRTRFPIEDQVQITKEGYQVLKKKLLKEEKDLTDAEVRKYEV